MTRVLIACTAASLAAFAVTLVRPHHSIARRRLATVGSGDGSRALGQSSRSFELPGVVIAGVATASFIGGLLGFAVGAIVGLSLYRWLTALPRSEHVQQRRAKAAELPVVTDLLAACLASGAPVLRSVQVVSASVRSGVQADLRRVAAALEMGASPDEAWGMVENTELGPMSSVMRRSASTGAPAALLLRGLANDLRAELRATALSDARRLGVRAAGPLGLCFLPAFLLIGVVPLVFSLVQVWT